MTQPISTHADNYHQVVDCQWACPAHTNVPEYIRLIAAERYADAYLLNRESNVFPGILGRVCDRPCEPACRRGRVDTAPVAICRLKRVAADLRGDISTRLPQRPQHSNGLRIALIGSGPAALTVANDLAPLGYQCTIFEKDTKPGGAMHASVPSFRLPESVLMEEIGYILNLGVDLQLNTPVHSLKALLADKYAAIFIGSGAPLGKDLALPGRAEAGKAVRIGLQWLAEVAFEHHAPIGKRVLIIGGGNTAMDCSRTALRSGGEDVTVIAPEGYAEMLASSWEKDDARDEGVKFQNHLLPSAFVVDAAGTLVGVRFQPLLRAYNSAGQWAPEAAAAPLLEIACDTVILAIGQSTAYPFIERDLGLNFSSNGLPLVDSVSFQSTLPQVFFGGDAAFGPKNIISAVAQGHAAAISIDLFLRQKDLQTRPPRGITLASQKMGLHEWAYPNSYSERQRQQVPHLQISERLQGPRREVELGFDVKLALQEASRCLSCDVQTVFSESQCIECDACIDICPVDCLTMTAEQPEALLFNALTAPRLNFDQPFLKSGPLPQTGRLMLKDENFCLHCGLCAERCPTGAWDMQKFTLQLPYAGVSA